jgi:hypothetical protein
VPVSAQLEPASRRRSIFTPTTRRIRVENFEDYWAYTQGHDGLILESEKDLVKKKALLAGYTDNPVRSRQPLPDPERFYRNYVTMQDDPSTFDRKTLLLTFLYKFARHEWVGICAAWDGIPTIAQSKLTTDKISRYHLCEEFCHVRLFHEMFRTFQLDRVEWVPLGKWMGRVYKIFPYFPESIMSPPAFVSELMGLTLYLHIDRILNDIFADEPEARERVRALLHEIIADEMAHVGQRRNFMGSLGLLVSKVMVEPMYRLFFRDIPEAKYLFDVDQMIADGKAFNYSTIPSQIFPRSWVPSYCQALDPAAAATPTAVQA